MQTHLSGPLSKSLTHYLRSKHSAILIGVSTAIADDPGLNCRLEGVGLDGQPRPIIIDPGFRWNFTRDSRVLTAAREGRGKAPYVIVMDFGEFHRRVEYAEKVRWLQEAGGGVFLMPYARRVHSSSQRGTWEWSQILRFLKAECQVGSLMIEGGGKVINSLLTPGNLEFVDSVIVTIAPVYLGKGGVNVSPAPQTESGQQVPAAKFKEVQWKILGNDVVMAARPDICIVST